MAKGQVSEEELAKGLKGIGNFGGLTESRLRRDNPFRDSRSDAAPSEPVKTIEVLPAPGVNRASNAGTAPAVRIGAKPIGRSKLQVKEKPVEKETGEKKQ